MKSKFRFVILNLPPWSISIVITLVILWLTLSPKPLGNITPPLFHGADKFVHAIMFGALVWAMILDSFRLKKRVPTLLLFCAFISSSLFGVAIEYLQRALNTGRSFDTNDMIADAIGALVASCSWRCVKHFVNL